MTANGTKPNGESLAGCITILILLVLLALWQYVLLLALVGGIGYGLFRLIRTYSRLYRDQQHDHLSWRLGKTVRSSGQALAGRLCRYREQYYLIDAVHAAASGTDQAQIHLSTRGLRESAGRVSAAKGVLQFEGPADWHILRQSQSLIGFLEAAGLELVDEISVEGKALRASLDCLEQADWARSALKRLSALEADVRSTLAKASGNALLEPSIPQLQEALEACGGQRSRLTTHIDTSIDTSKKLFDYLAVPVAVRSIINFDIDTLIDFSGFKDLEDSFNEVVAINDAFRELNRDRII